jgi:hypothetical protein
MEEDGEHRCLWCSWDDIKPPSFQGNRSLHKFVCCVSRGIWHRNLVAYPILLSKECNVSNDLKIYILFLATHLTIKLSACLW